MDQQFGDNLITITDEDGRSYELEILAQFEYKDAEYLALIPADADADDTGDIEVSILKSSEVDGEEMLLAIEDEKELEEVYNAMMDLLYDDEETELQ